MEKSQRIIDSANNRFSDIINNGFKLFFQNYGTLILPLAFFQIIVIILDIYLLTDLNWYIDSLSISISEIMEKFVDNATLTESEWNTYATFLLLTVGIVLWLIYGILIKQIPIILTNVVVLTLALCILVMKIKYG